MRTAFHATFLIPTLLLAACANDENPETQLDAWGEIAGTVTDVQGEPLAGVEVTVQGISAVSNELGVYIVDGVTPARDIPITYLKDGYAKTYGGATLLSWETVAANAVMSAIDGVAHFDASEGGTIQVEDVTVAFGSNAVVNQATGELYTGTVTVEITHVNPRTAELWAAPGDLRAQVKASGTEKDMFDDAQLVSYGMVDVSIFDNVGDPLQLEEEEAATVTMPIDQEGLATVYLLEPGDSQKVWSYDPDTVVWIDEGTGLVFEEEETGVLMFEFEASHFSWWNSDQGATPTCAEGKVIDTLAFPVRGAEVVCGGGASTSITYTDENGMYECPVLAGGTVGISSATFVADRTWTSPTASIYVDCPNGEHFCEVDENGMDGECYPVPDLKIDVCREAGIVMADNLEALGADDAVIPLDGLRAWFWDPPGDPAECQDPWASIPLDDCATGIPSDSPLSHPDISADGVPSDTKSVGSWFEVDNGRESFMLERTMQNGRAIYVWDTQTFADADGKLTADDLSVTPMDLRGGDPLGASAPGDTTDGMGAIDQPDLLRVPADLSVNMTSDMEIPRGGSVALTSDAGSHPDGVMAFLMTDKDEPALMCRFTDDGGMSIPSSGTSQLVETDSAGLAVFRAETGWVAGPDGLPIRIQAFSGTAAQVQIK